jgi:hypothetical protein
MPDSPRRPGLDGRSRNQDGTIRRKRGDTQVESLRKEYGEGFAPGSRSDMELETLRERTGIDSLSEYVKAGMPAVPPKDSGNAPST